MSTIPSPAPDRVWLLMRRAEIVSALADRAHDDRTGTGPSVVAQCVTVVSDELLRLVDELAPDVAPRPVDEPHGTAARELIAASGLPAEARSSMTGHLAELVAEHDGWLCGIASRWIARERRLLVDEQAEPVPAHEGYAIKGRAR